MAHRGILFYIEKGVLWLRAEIGEKINKTTSWMNSQIFIDATYGTPPGTIVLGPIEVAEELTSP